MSDLTRREFLAAAAVAVGASRVGGQERESSVFQWKGKVSLETVSAVGPLDAPLYNLVEFIIPAWVRDPQGFVRRAPFQAAFFPETQKEVQRLVESRCMEQWVSVSNRPFVFVRLENKLIYSAWDSNLVRLVGKARIERGAPFRHAAITPLRENLLEWKITESTRDRNGGEQWAWIRVAWDDVSVTWRLRPGFFQLFRSFLVE
jgi:hypothetical protein